MLDKVERIKKLRYERGYNDARNGEPPTEANPEYNEGYRARLSEYVPWSLTRS